MACRRDSVTSGIPSHSPYTGWMKWHHYAGLLFGVFTITWVFSGLVSLDVIPGIRESRYSPQQIAEGCSLGSGRRRHRSSSTR